MKIKMVSVLSSVLLLFSEAFAASLPSANPADVYGYLNSIKAELNSSKETLGDPIYLFNSKSFNILYKSAKDNAKLYLSILEKDNLGAYRTDVLVYALQGADLEAKIQMLKSLIELSKQGKASSNLVYRAAFPGYDFSSDLVENSDKDNVRAILKDIQSLPGLSEHQQKIIAKMMSGELKASYAEFKKQLKNK